MKKEILKILPMKKMLITIIKIKIMKMMMKVRNWYNVPKDAIESLKSRELKSMRKYVLRLLMLKEKYLKCMKYKNKTVKL